MRYLLFISLLIATSCTTKKEAAGSLQDLKAQLATKQTALETLKAEISEISSKIAKLDTTKTSKKILVAVDTLSTQVFIHSLDLQAQVTGDEIVNVSPKVPGAVTKMYAKKGMIVSKGQVLAQLDDNVMRQGIAELKSGISFAQTLYEKQKALWDQKIGSEVQYLSAKNNLESLNQKLITMREQLSMYRITAPISGTVDDVISKEGEMGSPGMPFIRVVNLRTLKLTTHPSESYIGKIKSGNQVSIFFPDINKTINSNVKFVGKVIDMMNRTFLVDIALPSSTDIRPNMLGVVKIKDYSNPNAIVIPINLLFDTETAPFVYALDPQTKLVAKKPVKLGTSYQDKIEILSGLKKGDVIITQGYQDINEGDQTTLAN